MCPMSNGSSDELEKFPYADPDTPPPAAVVDYPPPDAGMKSLDHYKRKLPRWRYKLRQSLLPFIRWETPYLAWVQDRMRSPALDSYFAITANLGTHTFFMTALPILFWCGYESLGRGLIHILASGVFFTGFIKDMLSLPRPLSPPLHRITMSGSAALEYGFPSTHSANAVSVAVYTLFSLKSPDCTISPIAKLILEILTYGYAFSITLGRLYCGMHGFVDVITGSVMGALLSVIECLYGAQMENYLYSSTWKVPCIVALVILVLVRIHPEPADDCPCFDDSVAFAGVMIGVELGCWHYALSGFAWDHPAPGTVPFDLAYMGWATVILRVLIGVLLVFAWRGVMKPTLLKALPHLFRIIEKFGLILPRKFFKPASEYQKIPSHLRVDNVMPSVSDLPSLLTSIRHPRRARSVSIGPQSAADAYETLAYRDKRRRESTSSNPAMSPSPTVDLGKDQRRKALSVGQSDSLNYSAVSGVSPMARVDGGGDLPRMSNSRVDTYEEMMGKGHAIYNSSTSGPGLMKSNEGDDAEFLIGQESELGEKEMFSRLEKPRVRYDVEVVTKLVVYTGIAWLAVEINPIIFEIIGLGMGRPGFQIT